MKLKENVKFVAQEKSQFFPTLKKRVDAYFKENNLSKHPNPKMVIKTFALLASYILLFFFLLAF